MDFLKTLLAYMALMATLSVQEGPAPQSVPTPTPLPAGVTATPLPNQTAAPTATPAPTRAPGPTLTPNKRYKKVAFGDSGSDVKKLQNRLIELGYMPKGSADSQYGYQTYNAVKAFQKANGLEIDGVAGPITLTYLYDGVEVVPVVDPTVVPTASPTPSLPPLFTPNGSSNTQANTAVTVAPTAEPTVPPTAAPTATAKPTPTAVPTLAPLLTVTPKYPDLIGLIEDATIISGTTGKSLSYQAVVGGKSQQAKPALWVNDFGAAVVSLSQLSECLDWSLTGSAAKGMYTLKACGYVITIDYQADGTLVLVDGEPIFVPEEDLMLYEGTLFVSEGFLRMVLNADTVFDKSESSLVLFLTNKGAASSRD